MSAKDFEKAIVSALRPAGFARFKRSREWRRERDGFLEEVDLQRFRGEPVVTVNFALRHQRARLLVGAVAGINPSAVYFSRSGRIGDFLGPMSLSWHVDDPEGPNRVQELIQTRLLPYFERMRTVEPYVEELRKYFGGRWTLIEPRLELAVLLHERGALEEARQLLADPPDRIRTEEQVRIASVRRHLFGGDASET